MQKYCIDLNTLAVIKINMIYERLWNFVDKHKEPFILVSGLALGIAAYDHSSSAAPSRHIFPKSRQGIYDFDRHRYRRSATGNGEFRVVPIPTHPKPDRRVRRASLPDTLDYKTF
jgi:hypothetical protein